MMKFGSGIYPYMKISSDTVPGEDVIYDSDMLKRLARGEFIFFTNEEPGALVEIREGSFVLNPSCQCIRSNTGEVGAHRQYWAVLDVKGELWLCRRTD